MPQCIDVLRKYLSASPDTLEKMLRMLSLRLKYLVDVLCINYGLPGIFYVTTSNFFIHRCIAVGMLETIFLSRAMFYADLRKIDALLGIFDVYLSITSGVRCIIELPLIELDGVPGTKFVSLGIAQVFNSVCFSTFNF